MFCVFHFQWQSPPACSQHVYGFILNVLCLQGDTPSHRHRALCAVSLLPLLGNQSCHRWCQSAPCLQAELRTWGTENCFWLSNLLNGLCIPRPVEVLVYDHCTHSMDVTVCIDVQNTGNKTVKAWCWFLVRANSVISGKHDIMSWLGPIASIVSNIFLTCTKQNISVE